MLSRSKGLLAISIRVLWQDQTESSFLSVTAEGGAISYVEDDFHLEIDEDIYYQCVVQLNQTQRKESRLEISRKEIVARTFRGRSLRLPHRYRQ